MEWQYSSIKRGIVFFGELKSFFCGICCCLISFSFCFNENLWSPQGFWCHFLPFLQLFGPFLHIWPACYCLFKLLPCMVEAEHGWGIEGFSKKQTKNCMMPCQMFYTLKPNSAEFCHFYKIYQRLYQYQGWPTSEKHHILYGHTSNELVIYFLQKI